MVDQQKERERESESTRRDNDICKFLKFIPIAQIFIFKLFVSFVK